MSQFRQQTVTPTEVFKLLKACPVRWIVPAVVLAAAAFVYALARPAIWEASQALTVRDEAAGGDRPGKFHVVEDMKTVQETILELAKSHSVLAATLKQIGSPSDRQNQVAWPTDQEVASLQAAVKLSPPKGAEFGKTEVFYLQVQSNDRERAIALASALSDQLKQRFADLRDSKAQSMVDELSKTVTLAEIDLKSASDRLARIDAEVGSDLGELRTLADAAMGDSPLRRSVTEMETELRSAQATNRANEELLHLLEGSQNDPKFLLAASSRLLEAQPALRRLKDSLMDAQLHTAQLLGSMSDDHPHVQTAKATEQEIGQHIRDEVEAAIGGVKLELHLSAERCATLDKQLAAAKDRLSKLAEIRADYANLSAEVHRRTDTLRSAENQLAEARASQAGAHTSSLISRIDTPDTGASPIGPSRSMIVLGGAAGGLLLGLAVLFLTIQPSQLEAAAADGPVHSMNQNLPAATNGHVFAAPYAVVNGDSRPNGNPAAATNGLSFKEALNKIEAGKRRAR
jgi:polysaccharide biosynthesis transport protein